MSIIKGELIEAQDFIIETFLSDCQAFIYAPCWMYLYNSDDSTVYNDQNALKALNLTCTINFTTNSTYFDTNILYPGSSITVSGAISGYVGYYIGFSPYSHSTDFSPWLYWSRKDHLIKKIPTEVKTILANNEVFYELTGTVQRPTNGPNSYSGAGLFHTEGPLDYWGTNWSASVKTLYFSNLASDNKVFFNNEYRSSYIMNNGYTTDGGSTFTRNADITHTFTIPNGITIMGKHIPFYFWLQNDSFKHMSTTDKSFYINGWRYIYPSGATWTTFKNNSNYNVIYGNSTLTIENSKVKHSPPYFTANGYATNNGTNNAFYLKDSSGNVVSSTASIIENHQYRTY